MSDCWLYKLHCDESNHGNGPLYVGISDSPSSRMANHESQKWWWWLVTKIEWDRYQCREDAKAEESRLIERLQPAFNYQESTLSSWDRMLKQVAILWRHEVNQWDCPPCPFCESHGTRFLTNPSPTAQVFRRNCDDELVIHWTVSCDRHRLPVSWANHCLVGDFLRGFGRCPRQESERLIADALRNGPVVFEDRMNRESTLLEMLENGTSALSFDTFDSLPSLEAADGTHPG